MCLPVALESIAHGESKQSLLFTVYFPSFFFQTILISAFLGKFTAQVSGRTVERQPCILCCYSGQDCVQLSGGGCLLLRCIGGVFTCGWKLTPTSFHLLGASQAVSAGQQRESPGLMHIATEQSLFSFPYGILDGASQLGVHRHIPGGL